MQGSSRRETIFDWTWFAALTLGSAIWCVSSANQLSATFDEYTDIVRAMDWWHHGSHRSLLRVGAMPLPMDLAALPLYVWERWHGSEIDLATDFDGFLPWARGTTLVFWGLLLIYGRQAGRQLAGPWGGRLAVALLACEPSFLAHASLATKDIAISACLLAFVYHFRTGRQSAWFWRIGVPSFWFGAAMLAKASGLVFGPLCMLAVEIERLVHERRLAAPSGASASNGLDWLHHAYHLLQPLRRDGTRVFWLGLALVFVYCGSDWQVEPTFVAWAHGLPDGAFGRSMVWVSEHLKIFSNAGEGLIKQVTHNVRGHGVYLLGETAPRAVWYYYPVTLTIKLSLPLLGLPILLLIVRPRALANWACAAAAALLLFSVMCRVQIGVRLMLPLVALAAVGLGAAVVRAWSTDGTGWRPLFLRVAASGGIAWTAFSAMSVWPHALCYTNELWGGTQSGYLCLSDSNYDWGQGLKDLSRWEEEHGLQTLDVWYFGTDPGIARLPMRQVFFYEEAPRDPADISRGHYLAVSTTHLYGTSGSTPALGQAIASLRALQPVARTQTYFIYDFTDAASLARSPSEGGHR